MPAANNPLRNAGIDVTAYPAFFTVRVSSRRLDRVKYYLNLCESFRPSRRLHIVPLARDRVLLFSLRGARALARSTKRRDKQKRRQQSPASGVLRKFIAIGNYEVISHQFLLTSLSKKCARPLVCSSRTSVMPSSLPFLENSLCASSTSSGVATCKVKRLASDR